MNYFLSLALLAHYCAKTVAVCTGPLSDFANTSNYVYMNYCGLTYVDPSDWNRFAGSVTKIDLNYNKFSQFPDFRAVASTLRTLTFTRNQITYIEPDYLDGLINLTTLRISSNYLLDFIPNVPGLGNALTSLLLGRCGFIKIPTVTKFSKLETLAINYYDNLLHTSKEDFFGMGPVETIQMKGTLVAEFPDFAHVAETLKSVDVTDGQTKTIPAGHAWALRKTTNVKIKNTAVNTVPTFCHESISALTLDLRGSPVDLCNCQNIWLKDAINNDANILKDNVMCNGNSWNTMTMEELVNVCTVSSAGRFRTWSILIMAYAVCPPHPHPLKGKIMNNVSCLFLNLC